MHESNNYTTLNKFAEQNGIVIFGGTEDMSIPLCELKQVFLQNDNLYNRSFNNLSVKDAISLYDEYIAPLSPKRILIHIGSADLKLFCEDSSAFDECYRQVINHIRNSQKDCRIAVISLKNPDDSNQIAALNKHLKYIAESEHCEFADIAQKPVWNPNQTKDVIYFLNTMGIFNSRKAEKPIYDLAKLLFCYNSCSEAV